MPDVTFEADVECVGTTCAIAKTRDFCFRVDEPEHLGGTDTGPNPVEYLLGAYAGCLNILAHMVADELGVKIEEMRIGIEGRLDPAGFMGMDPAVRSGFEEIAVTIDIRSDADEDTLERMMERINSRCPVGDNLKNPTPITTRLNVL